MNNNPRTHATEKSLLTEKSSLSSSSQVVEVIAVAVFVVNIEMHRRYMCTTTTTYNTSTFETQNAEIKFTKIETVSNKRASKHVRDMERVEII